MNAKDEWKKQHTVQVSLRFQKSTDADIIAAIENKPSMQGEIKRLIRLGLEAEMEQELNKIIG